MQRGIKNRDFRPIYNFISVIIQDRAIVTMEGEQETIPKLSNETSFNDRDPKPKFDGHAIT